MLRRRQPVPGSDAATPPSAASLEAGLAGQWQGALGYRDYQTDKLFELPVKTEIRALGDGVTIIRVSAFDDGPKAGTVYITTVSLHDPKAGTVTSASFRKNSKPELETEKVSVAAYSDFTHWTVRSEADGSDDDKPAKLRVTETRDGGTLLSVKEVLPAAADDGKWRFRNQTRLTRLP